MLQLPGEFVCKLVAWSSWPRSESHQRAAGFVSSAPNLSQAYVAVIPCPQSVSDSVKRVLRVFRMSLLNDLSASATTPLKGLLDTHPTLVLAAI